MAEETTTDPEVVEDGAGDPPPPEELGEPGKKALAEERQARKDAERQLKELSSKASRADELEAELAKLREDAMSEQEKALEQARKEAFEQGRTEALTPVNERLFKAEVKAASAGKIVDPDLLSDPLVAQRILGLDDIPVTSDGDIDSAAVTAAVDAMLEAKPHLAVSATRTPGSADQGARPKGTPPPAASLEDAYAAHYETG